MPATPAWSWLHGAFFAQKDTVTPLLLAAGSAALNIVLALLLIGPLRHGGLALANSIAVTLEVLALLWILRQRLAGIEGRETLATLARSLAASGVMSAAVYGALALAGDSAWAQVGLGGATGAVTYLLAARLLGVRQIERFIAAVLGRG